MAWDQLTYPNFYATLMVHDYFILVPRIFYPCLGLGLRRMVIGLFLQLLLGYGTNCPLNSGVLHLSTSSGRS